MRYTEEMILHSDSGYCMPFAEPDGRDVSLSLGYGEQNHPESGERFFHHGIDFGVRRYLLSAVASGVVSGVGNDPTHGICQTIRYGQYEVTYGHLSNVFAQFGRQVKAGQTVAMSGDLLHVGVKFKGEEMDTRMSFRMRSGEGKYEWWEFRSASYNGLDSEAPYMVLGVCQSIQRYKATEEELIAARDKALQADTLKSAFLANMSHEIRTPLNSIVGFSDLLKDIEAFSPEEVKQFVDTINTNCTLLLALINDILDLSRIESGSMDFRFAGYNLTFVMQQIYDSQRLSMPRGVELVMKLPEGEGKSIVTDSVRLKQVINNFINNAKKFTTQGSITFGFQTEEPGYTVFFVEDTGSGISEENQRRIFERFYKVDSFTQGAGLGLSICQTIVERFRGEINVSSELGKGTRFTVRVPDFNE